MATLPFCFTGPYGGIEDHPTMGPFSAGYSGDFGEVALGVGICYLGLVQWVPLDVFRNLLNCYIVLTISA